MKKLGLGVVLAFLMFLWLLSEFGPVEAQGPASICGIGVAVIALLKLRQRK